MVTQSVEKVLLKAKSLFKRGKFDEAKQLYQGVLSRFPDNKRALNGLSLLDERMLAQGTTQAPSSNIDELVGLYNDGDFAEVINKAQLLVHKYPNSPIFWNIMGASYKSLAKISDALFCFNQAIQLDPEYCDGYEKVGRKKSN